MTVLELLKNHAEVYQKSGEPGHSPLFFQKAMLAAQRLAQQNGETFNREEAARFWFAARKGA